MDKVRRDELLYSHHLNHYNNSFKFNGYNGKATAISLSNNNTAIAADQKKAEALYVTTDKNRLYRCELAPGTKSASGNEACIEMFGYQDVLSGSKFTYNSVSFNINGDGVVGTDYGYEFRYVDNNIFSPSENLVFRPDPAKFSSIGVSMSSDLSGNYGSGDYFTLYGSINGSAGGSLYQAGLNYTPKTGDTYNGDGNSIDGFAKIPVAVSFR